jgi:hypothetical protein
MQDKSFAFFLYILRAEKKRVQDEKLMESFYRFLYQPFLTHSFSAGNVALQEIQYRT